MFAIPFIYLSCTILVTVIAPITVCLAHFLTACCKFLLVSESCLNVKLSLSLSHIALFLLRHSIRMFLFKTAWNMVLITITGQQNEEIWLVIYISYTSSLLTTNKVNLQLIVSTNALFSQRSGYTLFCALCTAAVIRIRCLLSDHKM